MGGIKEWTRTNTVHYHCGVMALDYVCVTLDFVFHCLSLMHSISCPCRFHVLLLRFSPMCFCLCFSPVTAPVPDFSIIMTRTCPLVYPVSLLFPCHCHRLSLSLLCAVSFVFSCLTRSYPVALPRSVIVVSVLFVVKS